jgi:hypothetical protein
LRSKTEDEYREVSSWTSNSEFILSLKYIVIFKFSRIITNYHPEFDGHGLSLLGSLGNSEHFLMFLIPQ